MPTIQKVDAAIHEVPLRHAFVTARDQLARQVSRPVIITLGLNDGSEAVGEAVPVAYVTGETPESVLAVVQSTRPLLLGADVSRLQPILHSLRATVPANPTAIAGIEMALYSAHAATCGQSLWQLFGGCVREVETDVTLSIVADAPDRALESAEKGFTRFKVKVGGADIEEDYQRLLAIHRAVPSGRFRVDANQAFTPDAALRFIDRALAAGVPLELVEQPTPKEDLAALDAVAAASPVPIFADESVKSPADALRIVTETRAQGINVKVMKSGISGALDIIAIARAAGCKLMIGCMLEKRRGIACSLALACGTGAFDFVDLDSHLLLDEPGENPYFTQAGPRMLIPE
jgi:L-alanine-DL-glutamate epimerase-like enolase superfamily enzyme